jgi:hypothetical protein
MNIIQLIGAGIIAGIFNSIAGGGTFFTFPILIALGLPPVIANATNAVAVWPGHGTAAWIYKKELKIGIQKLPKIIFIVIIGSIIGTILLKIIGNESFCKAIPILILFATIIFAIGNNKNKIISNKLNNKKFIYTLILLVSIYGGFFGAGLGIMLMACLNMIGISNIHENNAIKNLLALIITSVSIAIFIFLKMVNWQFAIPTLIATIFGGIIGVTLAKKINPKLLKMIVIIIGLFLTIQFSYKYYL